MGPQEITLLRILPCQGVIKKETATALTLLGRQFQPVHLALPPPTLLLMMVAMNKRLSSR